MRASYAMLPSALNDSCPLLACPVLGCWQPRWQRQAVPLSCPSCSMSLEGTKPCCCGPKAYHMARLSAGRMGHQPTQGTFGTPACSTRRRRMQGFLVMAGSERVAKDPKKFNGDMDKMRAELENDGNGYGFISGVLNGISGAAFGDGTKGGPGGVFGAIGTGYRAVLSVMSKFGDSIQAKPGPAGPAGGNMISPPPEGDALWEHRDEMAEFWSDKGYDTEPQMSRYVNNTLGLYKVLRESGQLSDRITSPKDLALVVHFMCSVLVCQPTDAAIMAKKCPQVLDLPRGDVMQQMVVLKTHLPGADVSRMLQVRPSILVEPELQSVLRPQLQLMRQYLPGVNIDSMVQEHPYILFEEIESGLKQFRDLWPEDIVDEDTLAGSTHHELVLAIRALSTQGAPSKWSAGGME